MQTKVQLKNVLFYAYHGYYPEEQKTGNQFKVNLQVCFKNKEGRFVNYENLFLLTQQVIQREEPWLFLEEMAEEMIGLVREKYDFINEVVCEITKLKPPIAQFNGEGTSVEMIWQK